MEIPNSIMKELMKKDITNINNDDCVEYIVKFVKFPHEDKFVKEIELKISKDCEIEEDD